MCGAGECTSGPGQGSEKCDDGNGNENDNCLNDCSAATCGDGRVCNVAGCTSGPGNGLETCDDGNLVSGDGCSGSCGQEPLYICGAEPSICVFVCGNAYTNVEAEETCDDGDSDLNDSCPDGQQGSCIHAFCGDGYIWNTDGGTEECDGGAGCLPSCQKE